MKKVKIIIWRLTDWWFDGRQKQIHITDIKRHKRYLMKWDWLVVWWKVPRMLVPVTSTALPLKWKIFRLLWDKKITLYCFVIVVSSVTLTCNCLITRTVVEYFLGVSLLILPVHGIWAWLAQGQQRGLSHRGRMDDPLTHTTPPADLPLPDNRLYFYLSKLLMYKMHILWPQTLFMRFSRVNKFGSHKTIVQGVFCDWCPP